MKLYLDDERPAPPGWRLVRWPDEVIALLDAGGVTHLSLDHDLGDDARGTGYDVLLWIEEAVEDREFDPPALTVHSANTPARARMQAAVASIERLAREQRARHEALAAQPGPDLVRRALGPDREFKRILAILESRPPDEVAAAVVLDAHARGDAPPWLVAALLGRLRVRATYAVARQLLARGPGSLAEGYAGSAMARIAGDDARGDLLELLERGETRRIREGAAAGLARLAAPDLAPVVLAARRAGRICRDCAATTLAALCVPAGDLVAWLRGDDLEDRALAIRVVAELLAATGPGLHDRALARAAHDALAADRLSLASSRRQALLAALATCLAGQPD